jgi:RNA-binding protein
MQISDFSTGIALFPSRNRGNFHFVLTGKQRRHLRSLGHHLDPVVVVGKEAVSPSLVKATKEALAQHELVKVKLLETAGDRHALAEELAQSAGAELAGVLGRTALIYKRHPKEPKIKLPDTPAPARPSR